MKFRTTKIATAVAAGLGISAMGMSAAQADEILFPYFYVGDTVTSIVTVINTWGPTPGTLNDVLHYRIWFKEGAAADSLTADCDHGDQRRVTSRNDVVTFDLSGKFGDALGVLAEPANKQVRADYDEAGASFAFMKNVVKPARGFMVVDNNLIGGVETTISGEIFMMDFVEGAVWGYAAYNAAPSGLQADFQDYNETQGEVLAGAAGYNNGAEANAPGNGHSPPVPVGIMPVASAQSSGDVFTRFFVTPINHSVFVPAPFGPGWIFPGPAQFAPNLRTAVGLSVQPYTGVQLDTAFDRDELPVSTGVLQNVTCVGAVRVEDFFSSITVADFGDYGGWAGFRVTKPGPLVTVNPAGVANGRTLNTNQAIVTKLEYNPVGRFIGQNFKGAFNNSIWLRRGHRESLRVAAAFEPFSVSFSSPVYGRFTQFSANDVDGNPVDVGYTYPFTSLDLPLVSDVQ